MSRAETLASAGALLPARSPLEIRQVVLGGTLLAALAANLLLGWPAAVGLAALGIGFTALPFLFVPAIALVVLAASFVDNGSGHLTLYLSGLTLLILYALACLVHDWRAGRWALPRSRLTVSLALLMATTLAGTLHGLAVGNSPRYLGLELMPLLGLLIALMVGGLRLRPADLEFILASFVLAGLGHCLLGLYAWVTYGMRRGGIFFSAMPGMIGLLTLNLMLRTRSRTRGFLLFLVTCALVLHQILSFTRGYWLGMAAGLLASAILYVGRGPGVGERWRNLVRWAVLSWLAVSLALGLVAAWFGWSNISEILGRRAASSIGTARGSETASNVVRLVEWFSVFRDIRHAPWLGHGLGYSFHVRYPFFQSATSTQWISHEMYLLVWLKQGLVGLLAFLLVLFEGALLGLRGAWRLSGEAAGWSAGAMAATVYTAVFGLTNYPLAMVNPAFLLALMWGVALSLQAPRLWRIVWRRDAAVAGAPT